MKIKIDTPCNQDWKTMDGDAKSRFCSACQKSVHNLSAMSKQQAQSVLKTVKDPCVRYEKDANNQIIFRSTKISKLLFFTMAAGISSNALGAEESMIERGMQVVSQLFSTPEEATDIETTTESLEEDFYMMIQHASEQVRSILPWYKDEPNTVETVLGEPTVESSKSPPQTVAFIGKVVEEENTVEPPPITPIPIPVKNTSTDEQTGQIRMGRLRR